LNETLDSNLLFMGGMGLGMGLGLLWIIPAIEKTRSIISVHMGDRFDRWHRSAYLYSIGRNAPDADGDIYFD
jgi:hypothetical protein